MEFDKASTIGRYSGKISLGLPLAALLATALGFLSPSIAESRQIVVANNGDFSASLLDTSDLHVINTVDFSDNEYAPFDTVISPDGKRAYVLAEHDPVPDPDLEPGDPSGPGKIFEIDIDPTSATFGEVSDQVDLGNEVSAIAMSPDGLTLYATQWKLGKLAVVDTSQQEMEVVENVTIGKMLSDVAVSPNGKQLYISDFGAPDVEPPIPPSLSVIDTSDKTQVKESFTFTSSYPISLAVSPSGKYVYVSRFIPGPGNSLDGFISILKNNGSSHSISYSGTLPYAAFGFATAPAGDTVYTGNANASITKVDVKNDGKSIETETFSTTTDPDSFLYSLAVDPKGKSIYAPIDTDGIDGSDTLGRLGAFDLSLSPPLQWGVDVGINPMGVSVAPNQLPSLDKLTTSKESVAVGEQVTFKAVGASDPDGQVAKYMWDFGDGSKAVTTTGPEVAHIVKSAGSFKANVTAIDDDASFDEPVFTGHMSLHVGVKGSGTKSVAYEVGQQSVNGVAGAVGATGALDGQQPVGKSSCVPMIKRLRKLESKLDRQKRQLKKAGNQSKKLKKIKKKISSIRKLIATEKRLLKKKGCKPKNCYTLQKKLSQLEKKFKKAKGKKRLIFRKQIARQKKILKQSLCKPKKV